MMNKNEYRKAMDGVIYLCKCAVNDEPVRKDVISSYCLEDLYQTAKYHMLTALCGMMLASVGIHDRAFREAVDSSCRRTILLEEDQKSVFEALSTAGIWHMSLKGMVLKDWYPAFGMREMADCDILFDASFEETVRQIMVDLGFTVETYGDGHSDNYYKLPVSNFEMHTSLFGVGHSDQMNVYYKNVEQRLIEGDGKERYFSPEDFYIFSIAHEYKHYATSGTGVRSLLDTYVTLKKWKDQYDWAYIDGETKKLQIDGFERLNRRLAEYLFGDGTLEESDRDALEYIIVSGAYGTIGNVLDYKIKIFGGGKRGKRRYIKSRLFLPMDIIKQSFPFFYKTKILIPFLPLYRLFCGLKNNPKRLIVEWRHFRKLPDQDEEHD